MKRLPSIVALLFLTIVSLGVAWAKDKQAGNVITDCTTITQPGSYVLGNNISATSSSLNNSICILIASDFVTLDLAGFTIDGNGLSANGIASDFFSNNRTGIEVRSGVVTNFGSDGIFLSGTGHRVEHIRAVNNHLHGILVGAQSWVVGNTALNNGGIGIGVGCPSVVLENMAAGNTVDISESTISGVCTSFENNPAP